MERVDSDAAQKKCFHVFNRKMSSCPRGTRHRCKPKIEYQRWSPRLLAVWSTIQRLTHPLCVVFLLCVFSLKIETLKDKFCLGLDQSPRTWSSTGLSSQGPASAGQGLRSSVYFISRASVKRDKMVSFTATCRSSCGFSRSHFLFV
ncbi:hypothetical protein RRG08_066487 [Elysia crispata]|uniref:Uncharacterized protein n=1 Tax=Elysia crispata TaxID=231223 RepID=A0AAE1DQK7_9GAST|nr:hypothetical protein RRG08_066487 [Elysia crispata]